MDNRFRADFMIYYAWIYRIDVKLKVSTKEYNFQVKYLDRKMLKRKRYKPTHQEGLKYKKILNLRLPIYPTFSPEYKCGN